MIPHIGRVVTGSTSPRERGNATGHQAARRNVIVDSGHPCNVDRQRIEKRLSARHGSSRIMSRQVGPRLERIEDRRRELSVSGRDETAWLLELRQKKMDARIDADEKGLIQERQRTA